jgi:GlpG protein
LRTLTKLGDEAVARGLADVLQVSGITTDVTRSRSGEWLVWIHDEAKIDAARELLNEFQADPRSLRLQALGAQAVEARRLERREQVLSRVRRFEVASSKSVRARPRLGAFTISLVVACVAVTALTRFGKAEFTDYLVIASYDVYGGMVRWYGYNDILSGQVWRLITPIFLHKDSLHLAFNCFSIAYLGGLVERARSARMLLLFVLVAGVLSNVVEFHVSGPRFGGISGVAFGLFGYAWLRGRRDPMSGLALPRQVIVSAVVWFALCFTGILPIANGAHTGGLIVGAAWGHFLAPRRR